ncbi:MAG: L,D-transpeptidase family protein [Acidobacteria bacterium]|nr:L,D-transpeptidase family protein [Acidobacteriota bacterium]
MRLGLLVLLGVGSVAGSVSPATADEVQELLRNRIEAAGAPPRIVVAGELIHCSTVLPRFYERRLFRLAWSDVRGPLPQASGLVTALRVATREGLDPAAYHLDRLEALLAGRSEERLTPGPSPSFRVDLDLLLSDAFLLHASHLLSGRVEPTTFDPQWHVERSPDVDFVELLEQALRSGVVGPAFEGLLPAHPGYGRLRELLARYRRIERDGSWPHVADGEKLQRGDQGPRVEQTRRRLEVTGDLGPSRQIPPDIFDATLEDAVTRFQQRHGLEADGVVGRETLAALNVPISERVRQIELNLERWRWLPRELGRRHIVVNIPGFELEVVEGDDVVLEMRVVVGKPYRRTPVFSAEMSYLVFSPYWHVPPSIAANDIVPAVRKDPQYLAQKGIQVFLGSGGETDALDPASIDWAELSGQNLPYRFRQLPGPQNALGGVKFMFPNPYSVYLHDTPSRELFQRPDRTFSSGCIRLQRPLELAEYLLRGAPDWDAESIRAAARAGHERTVRLAERIPVHLQYWTAWADRSGGAHFRRDVYGRDRLLDAALRETAPTPAPGASGVRTR